MENKKEKSGKIVLQLNSNLKDADCFFCESLCIPDGLDFLIEGTNDFVCMACVKEKAPDLYLIHQDVHQWAENDSINSFNQGVAEGHKEVWKMILDDLEETPVDRIKRVCRVKLGAQDDLPF